LFLLVLFLFFFYGLCKLFPGREAREA